MKIISLDKFNFKQPSESDFLVTYNELLASEYYRNFNINGLSFSPTLNRLEVQTKCFEQIEMYIQISDFLKSNNDQSIIIPENKPLLIQALKKEFNQRILIKPLKKTIKNRLYNFKYFAFLQILHKFFSRYFLFSLKFYFKYFLRVKSFKNNIENVIITYFDHRNIDKNNVLLEQYFGKFTNCLSRHSNTLILFKFIHSNQFKEFNEATPNELQCIPFKSLLSPFKLIKLLIKKVQSLFCSK